MRIALLVDNSKRGYAGRVEAAIGAMQAGNGLERCRDKTDRGYERYVGLGILGRNLQTLGKLLLAHILCTAFQQGAEEVDLLKGREPYKEKYASDIRTTGSLKIYRSRSDALREKLLSAFSNRQIQ